MDLKCQAYSSISPQGAICLKPRQDTNAEVKKNTQVLKLSFKSLFYSSFLSCNKSYYSG